MFDYLRIHHNTVSNHTPSCVCLTRKLLALGQTTVGLRQSNPKMRLEKGIQMIPNVSISILIYHFQPQSEIWITSTSVAHRIRYFNHRIRSCYGPFKHRICQSCKRKADGLRGYPVLKHGLLEHPPFWSVMFENKPFMVDFPTHVGFEGKQFLVNKVQASTRTSRELTSVSWTV